MPNALRKSFVIGLSVVGLPLMAHSAQASPLLPGLTNLNFLSHTGVDPKAEFTDVKPTFWTGGMDLIFIAKPGTSSDPNTACGSTYLQTYGCPSTLAIPGGYNEVEADGNPAFETGFGTVLTGLIPGQTYEWNFIKRPANRRDFTGDTTEQWIVGLGTGIMQSDRTRHDSVRHHLYVFEPGSDRKYRGNTTHEHAVRRPDGLELRFSPADSGRSDPVPELPGLGRQRQHHQSSADLFLAGVDSAPDLATPEPAN